MEIVNGFVDRVIFKNDDNEYKVLSLITEDQEELVCVGSFPKVTEGLTLKIAGEFKEHATYGFQLKASSFEEIEPTELADIERYLASGAIKGIGESLAKKIVKKFGKDTFKIIAEAPLRLAEIKGISERIAQAIGQQFIEKSKLRDAYIFLQKYGISNNLATKIYEHYGDGLYVVLRDNPYRLAEDIDGVGFKIADEIARKMGISTSGEYRIRCGILYVLMQALQEGSTYLPKDILTRRCEELLKLNCEDITSQYLNMSMEHKLVILNDRIFSYISYYTELKCARLLLDLNITLEREEYERQKSRIERILKNVVEDQSIELDPLQETAVWECIKNGVTIISGGPGTGKTTTINTIIRFFEEEGMDILLAAPTGRAARRMQEATGFEARTIHRLLEVSGAPEGEGRSFFDRNEDNPLEADVVIVDEMSMVDINLFCALLKAIAVGTRLILVGDVDQLPSVGPGRVLKDIIDSGAFSVVMLEHIFRQAQESDIVLNAHRVNKGERISLDNKSRDFFFLPRNDAQVIYKHMVELIKNKLPRYVEASSMDIQVLTPMKKGLLGVEALNEILQQYLNPPDEHKKEARIGERLFREGDKVMQIKNNYQAEWVIEGYHGVRIDEGKGIFNGDTGVIKYIDTYSHLVSVIYDENRRVDYDYSSMDELELAYAVTIHKSQGSEYPAVIIPLLGGPKLLFNRNLLYTAITRAKRTVTILGREDTLFEMIDNVNDEERYTGLTDRIREVMHIEDS